MRRNSTNHPVNLTAICFKHIQDGGKDFIIMFDDSDFLIEDAVIFHELVGGKRTGNKIRRGIKHILRKFKGLQTGYIVLGFHQKNINF